MKAVRCSLVIFSLLPVLAGCDLIDPPDPRTLAEPVEECAARFAEFERELDAGNKGMRARPIYTFDVTKLSFEKLQELIVPGSDETVGQRLVRRTNEASTAVDQFMTWPVDDAGIFFLGRDPALYRVRAADTNLRDAVKSGCEMQQTGMRLIDIQTSDAVASETASPSETPEPSPSSETPS